MSSDLITGKLQRPSLPQPHPNLVILKRCSRHKDLLLRITNNSQHLFHIPRDASHHVGPRLPGVPFVLWGEPRRLPFFSSPPAETVSVDYASHLRRETGVRHVEVNQSCTWLPWAPPAIYGFGRAVSGISCTPWKHRRRQSSPTGMGCDLPN